MTYLKLFVDYLDAIQPLGDAELGRLFTALLQYARTGEAPRLSGNERFVYPMMKAQVDRDAEAAAGISQARSAAGKKGAMARKQKEQMPDLPDKSSQDKDQEKDKDQDQDEDDGKDRCSAVVAAYREKINPTPSERSLRELEDFAREMGTECCVRAFDAALDAKKANWAYIRGILRTKQEQGVRTLADWDRLEAQRARIHGGGRDIMAGIRPGSSTQPPLGAIERNNDWLDKFLGETGGA